jgi:hypothetical protein
MAPSPAMTKTTKLEVATSPKEELSGTVDDPSVTLARHIVAMQETA